MSSVHRRTITYSLKLQIVKKNESGKSLIIDYFKKYAIQSHSPTVSCTKKYNNIAWENQIPNNMTKIPEQCIIILKVNLLKKQKTFLEKQVYVTNKKVIIFHMMSNLAEQEYDNNIRKNLLPRQSITVAGKKKKI